MDSNAYVEGFDQIPERHRSTRLRVRCAYCGRLIAEMVTAPWKIRCTRCKSINVSG